MPPRTRKRAVSESKPAGRPAKRQATAANSTAKLHLNQAPTTRLDVYVCGSGESGELGLGSLRRNGKKPTDVRRPRLNDFLDAATVGVVQLDVGGMHTIALTNDGKILRYVSSVNFPLIFDSFRDPYSLVFSHILLSEDSVLTT